MKCRCQCCQGISLETPRHIENPDGRGALSYRVGEHRHFLESMLAGLGRMRLDEPQRLSARGQDDPSVALLDAGAVLADVVTFYQERIANEGFLRTAGESRSLLELASMAGYRPRPGVAASVPLAFIVDEEYRVSIPAGQGARSTPRPGETPQVFETTAPLDARDVWSRMKPRLTRPQAITRESAAVLDEVFFCGVDTKLKPNDALLFVFGEKPSEAQFRKVSTVEPESTAKRTRVTFFRKSEPAIAVSVDVAKEVFGAISKLPEKTTTKVGDRLWRLLREIDSALRELAREGSSRDVLVQVAQQMITDRESELQKGAKPAERRSIGEWVQNSKGALAGLTSTGSSGPAPTESDDDPPLPAVFAFRARAGIFGNNAPLKAIIDDQTKIVRGYEEWSLTKLNKGRQNQYLIELAVQSESDGDATSLRGKLAIQIDDRERKSPDEFNLSKEFKLVIDYPNPDIVEGPPIEQIRVTNSISEDGDKHFSTLELDFLARFLKVSFRFRDDVAELVAATADGSDRTDLGVEDVPPGALHALPQQRVRLAGHTPDNTVRTESERYLYLDTVVPQAIGGTWMVLERAEEKTFTAAVVEAIEASRAEYGISGKVTRLELKESQPSWIVVTQKDGFKQIRDGVVHLQPEKIELAEMPCREPVQGSTIEMPPKLTDALRDMRCPRLIAVAGKRIDDESGAQAELARVLSIHIEEEDDSPGTGATGAERTATAFMKLDEPLDGVYDRDDVTIFGNVASATHGETVSEHLGNGDGSVPNQSFTLKRKPLTYLPSADGAGTTSSLIVMVNGVRWHEIDDFSFAGPADHIYVVDRDDGDTIVRFGDGKRGARLPTGAANVVASYRVGLGAAGNVKRAEQIDQLVAKPLGLSSVTNPIPASGGADPDGPDEIRANASRSTRTLSRLVSVRDYADFAAAFAGIGKATATRLSDGGRLLVHVTVAGIDDEPLSESDDLLTNLATALRTNGEAGQLVRVAVRDRLLLRIGARVRILPDHQWPIVGDAIRQALHAKLGFRRRDFGQDVAASEVVAIMQSVPGVDGIDLDSFGTVVDKPAHGAAPDVQGTGVSRRVRAELARLENGAVHPAQLAILPAADFVPDSIHLEEWRDA